MCFPVWSSFWWHASPGQSEVSLDGCITWCPRVRRTYVPFVQFSDLSRRQPPLILCGPPGGSGGQALPTRRWRAVAGALRGSAVVAFSAPRCFMLAIHSLGFERLGLRGASCPCLESPVGWPDFKWRRSLCAPLAGLEAYTRVPSHQCRPPWPHSGQRLSEWPPPVPPGPREGPWAGFVTAEKELRKIVKCMASSLSFQPVEAKLRAFARGRTPVAG